MKILHLRIIQLERILEISLKRVSNIYLIFSRGLTMYMSYQIQSSQQPSEMVNLVPLLQMGSLVQGEEK